MAARGYEFYLRVLKVSLTSERSERGHEISSICQEKEQNCLLRVSHGEK